ncbi:fimbrial protein [Pseudenterobacter timonensis]|uniref:Fimbrial protein n=1 Tax=Pseudenterobacter timonensis TaxID=1755099 RepID=A0ABV4A9C6_9ENTR
MKHVLLVILLLLPFSGQAGCTLGGNTVASQNIDIDMTNGSYTTQFSTNLNDEFRCNMSGDKMYFTTPFKDYIIEFTDNTSSKSLFVKINITNDAFPVTIGNNKTTTQEQFNQRPFTLKAEYINSKSSNDKTTSNIYERKDAAISFLTTNSCGNNFLSWFYCLFTGKLNRDVSYGQYLTLTFTHKPTTCRFTQHQYTINMPPTTTNNMLTGKNTETGKTELQLTCDGVHNVSTNPVSFKVADGDWDTSGQILKNTLSPGATGVGFQIFRDNSSTVLKRGDVLESIKNRAELKATYIFPITARYVRIPGETLQPGEMQSRVKFIVDYN